MAHKLSRRKASLEQTFGLNRAELIAAFVNSLSLFVLAIYLIYEVIARFFHPHDIEPNLVI